MKLTTLTIIALCLSLTFISAMNVNLYHSPYCPHCSQIKPVVTLMFYKFHYVNWNFIDVTTGSYLIRSIPTIEIITDDKRNILLEGTEEIDNRLNCELQEMSTPECPTYSADHSINGSWFK